MEGHQGRLPFADPEMALDAATAASVCDKHAKRAAEPSRCFFGKPPAGRALLLSFRDAVACGDCYRTQKEDWRTPVARLCLSYTPV